MKKPYLNTIIAGPDRAEEAFMSGKVLYDAKLYNDSISRFYYMMLHLARALLLTDGLVAKTHRGTQQMFYERYVRTTIMPDKLIEVLVEVAKRRDKADYNSSVVFTQ